jgi:hypothetical protein
MNLTQLIDVYSDLGINQILIKELSPNDNSKNQVYLGGNFEVLNDFPIQEIKVDTSGDWKKERFKTLINFSWISEDGQSYQAPKSQLILYPKYPEVRFSGFLVGCKNRPSEIMTSRTLGRLLFLGVSTEGKVYGYACAPESNIANEYAQLEGLEHRGIFSIYNILERDTKNALINEMLRIHNLNWIDSKRLSSKGEILPCRAPNCGGYTLEAELGVIPNGYSEPDYLGWEIKQFGVSNFERIANRIITLMTPEPTGGIYKEEGILHFVNKYGYEDKKGRADRMNFGGIHRINEKHINTNLELKICGIDQESGKIRNADGFIGLIDPNGDIAASWSFSSMLIHWNRKHHRACYVPSMSQTGPSRQYYYGNEILLGERTDFSLFLNEMNQGHIYYDPGIKIENISTKPKAKKRSQFRIKSQFIPNLYKNSEWVKLTEE